MGVSQTKPTNISHFSRLASARHERLNRSILHSDINKVISEFSAIDQYEIKLDLLTKYLTLIEFNSNGTLMLIMTSNYPNSDRFSYGYNDETCFLFNLETRETIPFNILQEKGMSDASVRFHPFEPDLVLIFNNIRYSSDRDDQNEPMNWLLVPRRAPKLREYFLEMFSEDFEGKLNHSYESELAEELQSELEEKLDEQFFYPIGLHTSKPQEYNFVNNVISRLSELDKKHPDLINRISKLNKNDQELIWTHALLGWYNPIEEKPIRKPSKKNQNDCVLRLYNFQTQQTIQTIKFENESSEYTQFFEKIVLIEDTLYVIFKYYNEQRRALAYIFLNVYKCSYIQDEIKLTFIKTVKLNRDIYIDHFQGAKDFFIVLKPIFRYNEFQHTLIECYNIITNKTTSIIRDDIDNEVSTIFPKVPFLVLKYNIFHSSQNNMIKFIPLIDNVEEFELIYNEPLTSRYTIQIDSTGTLLGIVQWIYSHDEVPTKNKITVYNLNTQEIIYEILMKEGEYKSSLIFSKPIDNRIIMAYASESDLPLLIVIFYLDVEHTQRYF